MAAVRQSGGEWVESGVDRFPALGAMAMNKTVAGLALLVLTVH
jgi:hypothetical protein